MFFLLKMKLHLLLFLLLSILSISLLPLQVDARRLLLQKYSNPMKRGSDLEAKFHHERSKVEGESGGVPCDDDKEEHEGVPNDDDKGESEEGVPDEEKGDSGENYEYDYSEDEFESKDKGGDDGEDNQGDDSKDGDNDNKNGSDGIEVSDEEDPQGHGVNMKKVGD
ncbi:secreted acidic protein 1A-like [Cucurbita maxima]|uniref:Secreted acidic protein 1A-like n=1 Tax=Cucurbita maxima TaxID=3661 RepID=A0A6J1HS86_CUCMA|nr:secreted acidic protein 1A-like [Cucurbita maxima]